MLYNIQVIRVWLLGTGDAPLKCGTAALHAFVLPFLDRWHETSRYRRETMKIPLSPLSGVRFSQSDRAWRDAFGRAPFQREMTLGLSAGFVQVPVTDAV